MSKKILFTSFIFLFFITSPFFVSAQMVAELQAMINNLLTEITSLQTQLADVQKQQGTAKGDEKIEVKEEKKEIKINIVFIRTLSRGLKGDDVTGLQEYLAAFPDIYPEGLVTGYFGSLTEKAVQRFQKKHSVASSGTPSSTGYGLVGPKTRAKLNELMIQGAGESEVIPPGLSGTAGVEKDNDVVELIKDITVLAISNIQETNFAENSITITWDSDGLAKSKIEYSTFSPVEDGTVAETTDLVLSHRINLTGLSADTTYYYVVSSTDASENVVESAERVFSTATAVAVKEAVASDVLGHWTFDETEGEVVKDSSGNGNDGTLVNVSPTLARVTGKIAGALKFDGVDDYASIPHGDTINVGEEGESYSISFWFNRSGVPNFERFLLGKSENAGPSPFEFRFNQNSYVTFRITDGAQAPYITPPKTISGNGWNYIVGVRNAEVGKIYLYINGEEGNGAGKGLSVLDTTKGSIENTHPIRINRTWETGKIYKYDPFSVDDIQIYNRALSATEIKEIYDGLK